MIESNKSIRILNISKNYVTDYLADSFREVMTKNHYINELYLYWNNLKAKGAKVIFESIIESDNETLKVLDLSWNNIGDDKYQNCVHFLSEMLIKNRTIIHLDLSNNNFNL